MRVHLPRETPRLCLVRFCFGCCARSWVGLCASYAYVQSPEALYFLPIGPLDFLVPVHSVLTPRNFGCKRGLKRWLLFWFAEVELLSEPLLDSWKRIVEGDRLVRRHARSFSLFHAAIMPTRRPYSPHQPRSAGVWGWTQRRHARAHGGGGGGGGGGVEYRAAALQARAAQPPRGHVRAEA